jgi:archaellum component FlaD/FlaE
MNLENFNKAKDLIDEIKAKQENLKRIKECGKPETLRATIIDHLGHLFTINAIKSKEIIEKILNDIEQEISDLQKQFDSL